MTTAAQSKPVGGLNVGIIKPVRVWVVLVVWYFWRVNGMAGVKMFANKPAQMYKFGRVVVDGQHRHRDIKKVAQCPATGLYWWRVIGAIYEDGGRVYVYSYRLGRRVMEICTDFDRVAVADVKCLNL